MTATITGYGDTIQPDLVLEYSTARDSRNVYHDVVGKSEQDVSLEVDGKRYGTLKLFFSARADAVDAFAALAQGVPYEFADTDIPQVGMRFARDGSMTLRLTDDRNHWIVDMDYREII
jgi:hypothetical protein